MSSGGEFDLAKTHPGFSLYPSLTYEPSDFVDSSPRNNGFRLVDPSEVGFALSRSGCVRLNERPGVRTVRPTSARDVSLAQIVHMRAAQQAKSMSPNEG